MRIARGPLPDEHAPMVAHEARAMLAAILSGAANILGVLTSGRVSPELRQMAVEDFTAVYNGAHRLDFFIGSNSPLILEDGDDDPPRVRPAPSPAVPVDPNAPPRRRGRPPKNPPALPASTSAPPAITIGSEDGGEAGAEGDAAQSEGEAGQDADGSAETATESASAAFADPVAELSELAKNVTGEPADMILGLDAVDDGKGSEEQLEPPNGDIPGSPDGGSLPQADPPASAPVRRGGRRSAS